MAVRSRPHDSPLPTPSITGLKIAIIGFGNLARFLAKTLVSRAHSVIVYTLSDCAAAARSLGVSLFRSPGELCDQHPDVLLFCISVSSAQKVLESLPLHRLRRNTLFADAFPVKEFPRNLFLRTLPVDFDILCTRPMFRSGSGRNDWDGLVFVYDKVRVGAEERRARRCEQFLGIFAGEGCRMVEMDCAEHDKCAAGSEFVAQTVGRMLQKLQLKATPIDTRGYEILLGLVDAAAGEGFDSYCEMFVYNKNAVEQFEKMYAAFQSLRKLLFGSLHEVLWKQLSSPETCRCRGEPNSSALEQNHAAQPPIGADSTSRNLNIAIVGFGNFGQFLAKAFVRQGHAVSGHSRSDHSGVAQRLGVSFFLDAHELCEAQQPEVVLFCTSIISTEQALGSFPIQKLKQGTLFVDVLSVKEFPRDLFLRHLPPCFDILCTHPMFGPESGGQGWGGLPFVFDRVRVGGERRRASRCDRFLDIFARERCRMVEMGCAEHDRHAAGSQFVAHTVGRALEGLRLAWTAIDGEEHGTLLRLVETTAGDSFDLYYGLFRYNKHAVGQMMELDLAFDFLKNRLFWSVAGASQISGEEPASLELIGEDDPGL